MEEAIYVTPEGQAAMLNQAKEMVERIVHAWEHFKQSLAALAQKVLSGLQTWMGMIYKVPGYKRKAKAKLLTYYESVSMGKPNNWRRVHGLHLARCRC